MVPAESSSSVPRTRSPGVNGATGSGLDAPVAATNSRSVGWAMIDNCGRATVVDGDWVEVVEGDWVEVLDGGRAEVVDGGRAEVVDGEWAEILDPHPAASTVHRPARRLMDRLDMTVPRWIELLTSQATYIASDKNCK